MSRESPYILLVEENELLAEITAFRLELLGYSVHCLHLGREVQERATADLPDLILLDAVLPDTDGIEVIHLLRSDERTAQTPILLLSIDADLDAVERAYRAGANDYLVTPFDPAVMQKKIENLVAQRVAGAR